LSNDNATLYTNKQSSYVTTSTVSFMIVQLFQLMSTGYYKRLLTPSLLVVFGDIQVSSVS